jgi:hypothetical protein
MTHLVKILWINQQDITPIDGLGQIERSFSSETEQSEIGQKVWFSRSTKDQYDLYTLDPEALKQLEADHEVLCTKMNRPLYHGAPFVFKQTKQTDQIEQTEQTEQTKQTNITIYNRMIEPKLIQSEYLVNINKSQFSNYFVPHRIE